MKSIIWGVLLSSLLLTGCIVPQSRLDDAAARSLRLEKDLQEKNQELSKSSKKMQELETTNKTLMTELARSRKQVADLENELRENQVWADSLLIKMKNIH